MSFSQAFLDKQKQSLLEHQQRLTAELAGLPAHSEVGDDLDEAATEVQIDDVNRDVSARIRQDLADIAEALERIENGTYGLDVDTGEPIDEKRLEFLPWAKKAV